MARKADTDGLLIARNKKAYFDYTIEDEVEAGLMLMGSEVKSLRAGKANIEDAYAGEKDGALWLINAHITEYAPANRFGHEPLRPRKLLLHKREMEKLLGKSKVKGYTLIPLSLYFNKDGRVKLKLGVAHGKRQYEKRETIKNRDWERQKAQLMRKDA